MPLIPQSLKATGRQVPNVRTPFHLYNKLPKLAQQSGWQLILMWQQNAPLPHTELDNDLKGHIKLQTSGDEKRMEWMSERVNEILGAKKVLNFPCQLAIFKRK